MIEIKEQPQKISQKAENKGRQKSTSQVSTDSKRNSGYAQRFKKGAD